MVAGSAAASAENSTAARNTRPCFIDLSPSSCDPDHAHHAAFLVLKDVAVEHPVARVVGHESNLNLLAGGHQDGVLPFAIARGRTVATDDPEGVAVQVHGVPPCGLVAHGEHVGLAALQ